MGAPPAQAPPAAAPPAQAPPAAALTAPGPPAAAPEVDAAPTAADPPAAAQGTPGEEEEDEFYSGKTQAMELKPAVRNADGTYSCAYCNNILPPDVKATCPSCQNIVIGL